MLGMDWGARHRCSGGLAEAGQETNQTFDRPKQSSPLIKLTDKVYRCTLSDVLDR